MHRANRFTCSIWMNPHNPVRQVLSPNFTEKEMEAQRIQLVSQDLQAQGFSNTFVHTNQEGLFKVQILINRCGEGVGQS